MAKRRKKKEAVRVTPRPTVGADLNLREAVKRQPIWLQQELESVRKYEEKVLEALKDEANAQLFTRDPGALLSKLKVPMSGAFRERLRGDSSLAELKKAHCFKLPNGHVIKPNIRIRFTKEED
ncbi:MAG: hypothetical protein ACE5JI_00235 [Acidobacteriota bacterium]